MDFDEYEYIEKTFESPQPSKAEETENGGGKIVIKGTNHSRRRDEKGDKYIDVEDAHRSRRSKFGDDSRDRDRRKERRHRSRSRDGGRDQKRNSREHKDRDREREERSGRDRDRDQRNSRDRREHDHDSEKAKDKDGESRWYKEKKEGAIEPEVDPERDQRTVFAYQINLKATEKDVYDFFSRAGKVRDVRLIMDRMSRRSRGVGYIEFYDVMSVPMAIALSGQPLRGQPVMVKPSEAEKNLVQSTTSAAAALGGSRRLYAGNLHASITEDQLRQVFEPFGTVELVQLPLDDTGHCKGFGFVQFSRLEDARSALNLNGEVEIAGRPLEVSTVTNQIGEQDVGTKTGDIDDDEGGGLSLNAHSRALLMQKLDRSGTHASSSMATSLWTGVAPTTVPILGVVPAISSLVTPFEQGSIPPLSFPGSITSSTILTIDSMGTPSECLLLKNMFDPKLETELDFDLDIKEDVEAECSKLGNLKHIYVEKNSAGLVYLRFDTLQAAAKAQRSLHGRFFAGKMVTATFMVPQSYKSKFPDSR